MRVLPADCKEKRGTAVQPNAMNEPLLDTDSATKHLVRHLHEPTALRDNPLVAHFFAARREDGQPVDVEDTLCFIRDLVVTTVDRVFVTSGVGRAQIHMRRQREILLRCDIGGESDKVVQSTMGLERRQFYREKERARIRLGRVLRTLAPARLSGSASCIEPARLSFVQFRSLREAGDATRAIALGTSLWQNIEQPQYKLEAGALLVECYAEGADWPKVDKFLESMREIPKVDARSRAIFAWADGQRAWYLGSYDRAAALAEEMIGHLQTDKGALDTRDEELRCMTYLQLAHSKYMLGAYEMALAALQTAREIVEARPDLPPRVIVNVLFHLGGLLGSIPGCAESAERYLQEAYAIASNNGLIRDASGTALGLAHLYLGFGEIERAVRTGRAALAVSAKVRGAAAHGWHCLSFTVIELAAGNARAALALARENASDERSDPSRAAYARSVQAEALLQLGDLPTAMRLSASAAKTLGSRVHSPRLRAYALRVYSEAALRFGKRAIAHDAFEESAELQKQLNNPRSLAATWRTGAAVTGSTTYRSVANELVAAMRRA